LNLPFYKYQAAGNDFVLIDNRDESISLSSEQIARLCDRKFGVGADGVIFVSEDPDADYHVTYFNPDGTQSLCGNGCRSAVELARRLGLAATHSVFNAYDGKHFADILTDGLIRIRMSDVDKIDSALDGYYMNTGSPHFVRFVRGLDAYPVFDEGKSIRYNPIFPIGANANFIERIDDHTLALRTYERGVEQETLACGTGATAAALAASLEGYHSPITLKARGGDLIVDFKRDGHGNFTEIHLTGPAQMVFRGEIEI
jgi:diaminopimelate epimerase